VSTVCSGNFRQDSGPLQNKLGGVKLGHFIYYTEKNIVQHKAFYSFVPCRIGALRLVLTILF
jgi:hypothetical protein